jgi:hypothetical protein
MIALTLLINHHHFSAHLFDKSSALCYTVECLVALKPWCQDVVPAFQQEETRIVTPSTLGFERM